MRKTTFSFTSDVAGTIKYSVNAATFLDSQDYNVTVGANTFKVRFTAGSENYSCLELGGLGNFKLTFTGIAVKEVEIPTEPEQPESSEQPENLEQSESTEQSENPVQSENFEQPESSEQPENSEQKGNAELAE